MRTFIYQCPATGYNVQGEYDPGAGPLPSFVMQTCLACHRVHVVDPTTGRLMAEGVSRPEPGES